MDFDFTTYGLVTIICYLIIEALKNTSFNSKLFPLVSGVIGTVVSVICLYAMPDFPADNLLSAIIIGFISGLAATGTNQIFKQITKDEGSDA